MSATQTPPEADADAAHDHHPTPRDYVRVAAVLFALTAMEVSTYFFEFGGLAVPMLVVLMAIKFALVAGWFMHLRFDTKVYTRFLYGGLTLAIVLYVVVHLLFAFDHAARV